MNRTDRYADFDQPVTDNPYPLYSAMRDTGPVHRVQLADGRDAWIVTRYEDARAVLTDPRFFKDVRRATELNPGAIAPGFPLPLFARNMLSADPPDHTRLRGLVGRVFTPPRVERMRPRIQAITDSLLDAVDPSAGPVDLVSALAFPLPIIVICELLGVPPGDRDFMRDRFTRILVGSGQPYEEPDAVEAADDFVAYFEALFDGKRAAPGDDLISAMVAVAEDGERLSDAELLCNAFLLLLAGHETTANLIGNGTVALLRHPDQMAALRADPSLLPAAVDEALRYDGPVQHSTNRFATEDVELGGVTIRRGDPVFVQLSGVDRDPSQFPDPDTFDVHRADNHHLAFGFGIHFCLGAPLARLEGEVAFGTLLRRYADIRLAVEPDELHWRYGMIIRSLLALPVHLTAA